MASKITSAPSARKPSLKHDVEFEPDAWERFERAVKVVAKSPPQHRVKAKPNRRVRKAQTKKPGR